MFVLVKHPIAGFSYFGGETIEIADSIASDWVKEGFAILIPPTEGDPIELPEDLPSRALLIKEGFTTIEQILNADTTLVDIKGIGEKAAQAILTFSKAYEKRSH